MTEDARHCRPTILLVEDQLTARRAFHELLEHHGYNVLAAADGRDALATLATYRGPVHLLLVEASLPGMNGLELADRLCAIYPTLRVLYISGYPSDPINLRLSRHVAGRHGSVFLHKPMDLDELLARVRHLLDGPARKPREREIG